MYIGEVKAKLDSVFRFVKRDSECRSKNFMIVELGKKDRCKFVNEIF